MPCLCGDLCCPSCGPAQGNSRCELCGAWISEGCEHYSVRTGRLKRKYRKQAAEVVKAEFAREEAYWPAERDEEAK